MDKKSIITGVVIGLVSNATGLFIVCLFTANMSGHSDGVTAVLEAAISEDFIGKLISLGAILNLICFFYFIRKKKDGHAGGILITTILIALGTFIIKL
tara:strand:+ start:220 stop:513 length:294 start_codon:yes stop_codon:yes gene_type:complete